MKKGTNAFYQEIFASEFIVGAIESEAQWPSIKPLQNGSVGRASTGPVCEKLGLESWDLK
jgi:hypothetical protein